MRAHLSVVIPTRNAAAELPATLSALMEGLQNGVIRELILTDGGSADPTQRIAEEVGALWVNGPASRGGQLRRGAATAKGEWLLFLHADTHLSSGWSDKVEDFIATHPDRAGYGTLQFRSAGFAGRCVAGWANIRSRMLGLPYGDQALLISRKLYDELSGFPDQPLMEDVAIAQALRGRLVAAGFTAATSPARYETEGWILRGGKNLWLLLRYLCGVDPQALARVYQQKGRRS